VMTTGLRVSRPRSTYARITTPPLPRASAVSSTSLWTASWCSRSSGWDASPKRTRSSISCSIGAARERRIPIGQQEDVRRGLHLEPQAVRAQLAHTLWHSPERQTDEPARERKRDQYDQEHQRERDCGEREDQTEEDLQPRPTEVVAVDE